MSSTATLVSRIEAARADLEEAEAAVEDVGESRLRALQDAHDRLTSLLGRYEDSASGSGDFQAFIEFQDALAELVEDLPENLPEREIFEDIDEAMQKRRLTERDFEAARADLEPVEALVARLEDRREARDRVKGLERQLREAIHETRQEIDRLETVRSLGDADLDAPVEKLRDPVETYNDSVRSAFSAYRETEPARAVIDLVETAQSFPLLTVRNPPSGLGEFLATAEAGTEPIPTLLEYTEYSRSKLSHYVDDPATFQRVVGGNRTYLERLDADPYTIEWPPPAADELRWRARELVSMLDRFAPAETIAALDTVRDLAREEARYSRLRDAARAKQELTPDERERLAEGRIEGELETARERLESLRDALEG